MLSDLRNSTLVLEVHPAVILRVVLFEVYSNLISLYLYDPSFEPASDFVFDVDAVVEVDRFAELPLEEHSVGVCGEPLVEFA